MINARAMEPDVALAAQEGAQIVVFPEVVLGSDNMDRCAEEVVWFDFVRLQLCIPLVYSLCFLSPVASFHLRFPRADRKTPSTASTIRRQSHLHRLSRARATAAMSTRILHSRLLAVWHASTALSLRMAV